LFWPEYDIYAAAFGLRVAVFWHRPARVGWDGEKETGLSVYSNIDSDGGFRVAVFICHLKGLTERY